VAVDQHSIALVSLRAGRPREALDVLGGVFDYVASSGNTSMLVNTLEVAAAITAGLGDALETARLAGAAETMRQESGMAMSEPEAAMLEEHLAPARATVTPADRDAELAAGRALSRDGVLALLRSLSTPA